jgi:hypothetical protein
MEDGPNYDENIDMNHTSDIIGEEEDEGLNTVVNTYNGPYEIGDLFILIMREGDDIIEDSLVIVQEIKNEEMKIYLKDENDNDSFIYFNDDRKILLQTNDYEIIDIEKVEEFDINMIDDVELMIAKDLYPEIDLQMVEVKDKIYSLQERKENLITELISLYNAYNNETLIHQISEMSEYFAKMLTTSEDTGDYSDTLSFVKDIIHKKIYKFPSWVIPIVDSKKVIYKDKEDIEDPEATEGTELEIPDDIIIKNNDDELKEKIEAFSVFDDFNPNTYQSIIALNNSYRPYVNKPLVTIPYTGMYFRSCTTSSPCNGLINQFVVDINKTKNPLIIPFLKDQKTIFETITPEEQISIIGFYILPHKLLNFTLRKNNSLTLHELYFLSDYKYSYIPFHKRFLKSEIVPHILSSNSEKIGEWDNLIHSYLFSENPSLDKIGGILERNFPDYGDIINVIPKEIKESIMNYNDIKKVFISYDVNYHEMSQSTRDKLNIIIKNNGKRMIRNYNKLIKRKKVTLKPAKQILLTTDDKIRLSKEYILSLHIHSIRNSYIKRFIKTYSRKSEFDEDPNYMYEKSSNNKLLCNHYLYACNTDQGAFETMRSVFGKEPSDGIISCKNCGEYLCPDDFSTLEGFSGGAPTSSSAVIESDDIINQLNEKQLDIKKHIQKISNIFGITLTNHDIQKIIEMYDLIDSTAVINYRYNSENAFNQHPLIIEAKEKYKTIKGEKKENKIKKSKLEAIAVDVKEYMLDCNELLITSYLTLFFLQTANPPYSLNTKIDLNIWDDLKTTLSWDNVKHTISEKISMETVDTILVILQKMISINKKDKFWRNCDSFLKESIQYEDLPSFNENFIMISSYLLKNSTMKQKLKQYFNLKNNIRQTIYLNEYWPSYKPLYENSLISSIHEKINNETKRDLLRNGSTIVYENICSIQPMEEAYTIPRYQFLQIPYSDIMNNESYGRLFDYSNHLHGKTESIPIINSLVKRFLNTIPDSQSIEQILETIGWDSFTKDFKSIEYHDFKQVFIVKITEYFKNKNIDDKNTIDTYVHIRLNNWNGMLLNGNSKRNYDYSPPIIFPNQSYEELIETDIMNKLFNKYCLDHDDMIKETYDNDQFIFNMIADPSIEREAVCVNIITKSKDNFHKILDHKRNSTKLPLQDITNVKLSVEGRLHNFIKINKLTNHDTDEVFEIFKGLNEMNDSDDQELEYSRIFNKILQFNESFIDKIQQFFVGNNDILDQKQIQRFQTNFGRKTTSLQLLLTKYLERSKSTNHTIKSIFFIIGRLSKPLDDLSIGTIFHDTIPKQWKLSETNTNYMKDFINRNEFLLHNDVFIPQKTMNYEGFTKYKKERKHALCFQGLMSYLLKYYRTDIDTIIGYDGSGFTEEYSDLFIQFIFLFLFSKIIDYIEDLKDEESPASKYANELFLSLEEQDSMELKESIEICSQFSFDLLTNFLEEWSDPSWIYQNELLSDKLGKQKEREKQSLIDNLESKTSDSRLVTMHLQNAGITNWFGNAAKENLNYLSSTDRENHLVDERINNMKELLSINETQLEVLEGNGINTDGLVMGGINEEDTEIEDEGYDQIDNDREDEGLDDNDDDGDYHEN